MGRVTKGLSVLAPMDCPQLYVSLSLPYSSPLSPPSPFCLSPATASLPLLVCLVTMNGMSLVLPLVSSPLFILFYLTPPSPMLKMFSGVSNTRETIIGVDLETTYRYRLLSTFFSSSPSPSPLVSLFLSSSLAAWILYEESGDYC